MTNIDINEYPYKAVIAIEGMACEHCVHRVQNALLKLGVLAETDLDEKQAIIYMKEPLPTTELIAAIDKLGFKASAV